MQKVAVIGLGRFGMALAETLAKDGLEVIAIDNDPEVVDAVKDKVALAVTANATELDTQRSLGLGKVDTVVIAIGENFEACQLAMLSARDLDYPRVIARANDRVKETILRRLGAEPVVEPLRPGGCRLKEDGQKDGRRQECRPPAPPSSGRHQNCTASVIWKGSSPKRLCAPPIRLARSSCRLE